MFFLFCVQKEYQKDFPHIEVLLKWKCPLVYLPSIYRVSTEYLPSIYTPSDNMFPPHRTATTRAQTQTPHNCWKLSSVPSLPRRASVHKQRRSCLRKTSGMCPELINILGNAIVKYLQYVVKHRAFWQKQFKTRLGWGMAKIWKNWAKKCQLRSWWYLRGSKFIKVADTPVTTSRPAGMLKQFDRGSPGSGLVFVSDSNQRANLSTPTCTQ